MSAGRGLVEDVRRAGRRCRHLLERYGIRSVGLEDYDGRTTDAVKVGTYNKARGLEFKYVFLPGLTDGSRVQNAGEPDPASKERIELEHQELYVAMTRARDGRWMGYLAQAI